MARSNIPMVINLRQNKNDESTAYGKYFAEVDTKKPLNLKGFAKHMTSHGKIADYQMCVLVICVYFASKFDKNANLEIKIYKIV